MATVSEKWENMSNEDKQKWTKEQIENHYDIDNHKISFVQNGKDGTHLAIKKENDDMTMILECIRVGDNGKDIWIRSEEAGVEIKFDSFQDMIKAIDKTKAKEYKEFERLMPISNTFDNFTVTDKEYSLLEEIISDAIKGFREIGKTDKEIAQILRITESSMKYLEKEGDINRAEREAEEEKAKNNGMSDKRLGKYTHILEGRDSKGNDICYLADLSGYATDGTKYVDLKDNEFWFVGRLSPKKENEIMNRISNIKSITSVADILDYMKDHCDNPRKTEYYIDNAHQYNGEHMVVGGFHNMVILPDLTYNWDENLWNKEDCLEVSKMNLKMRDKMLDTIATDYLEKKGFRFTTSADEILPDYYEQAKGWIDGNNIEVDTNIYHIINRFAEQERKERENDTQEKEELDR